MELPDHVSYLMAEVEQCKQADIDLRGHDDFLSESGGMMDFEEDRIRPKRYHIIGPVLSCYFG